MINIEIVTKRDKTRSKMPKIQNFEKKFEKKNSI